MAVRSGGTGLFGRLFFALALWHCCSGAALLRTTDG